MNTPKRTTSPQNSSHSSQHISQPADWIQSAPLSQSDQARMEYALVTKVLFGPIYADVVGKLLDTGRPSEIETLIVSFDNARLKVMEKNTELASYSSHPLAGSDEYKPMTKQEIAREAGKISLKRFLNKDSLKRLHDIPLEKWGGKGDSIC